MCKTPFVCTARSAQALILHRLAQDAGGAGFVGAEGVEFPGQVVGQFDHEVALHLVGVVVWHVQAEVGRTSSLSTFLASSIILCISKVYPE